MKLVLLPTSSVMSATKAHDVSGTNLPDAPGTIRKFNRSMYGSLIGPYFHWKTCELGIPLGSTLEYWSMRQKKQLISPTPWKLTIMVRSHPI